MNRLPSTHKGKKMLKQLLIITLLAILSPELYACAILGVWDLESETQKLLIELQPEGKAVITRQDADGKMSKQAAMWQCKANVLSLEGEDGQLLKKFTDIRMMTGIIMVMNEKGEMESYLHTMPAQ